MGHPPECLEGAGGILAWVGLAGGGALSCPHQVLQLTSGSSKVLWRLCQVSIICCSACEPVAAMQKAALVSMSQNNSTCPSECGAVL